MKRMIALLLIMLLLFCGCKPAEEPQNNVYTGPFETYIINGTNGEADTNGFVSPWSVSSYTENKSLPQEKTLELLGKEYVVKYEYSARDTYESYITDHYITDYTDDGNENFVRLGLHSETGNVVFADFGSRYFYATDPLLPVLENPREYAIEKAKEIAACWIDVSLYEQRVELSEQSKTIDGIEYEWTQYYVYFFRSIGDIKTSDYMSISFTSRGSLSFITLGDIGAFADFKNEECTIDAIESSIGATLQKVQKEKNREEQTHKVEEHIFAMTPDGEYVVCSTLSVSYRDAQTKDKYESGALVITRYKNEDIE